MRDDDPRRERLDHATTRLALLEIGIWKLAAATKPFLDASGDPDARRLLDAITSAEDERTTTRMDIRELYAELLEDGTLAP